MSAEQFLTGEISGIKAIPAFTSAVIQWQEVANTTSYFVVYKASSESSHQTIETTRSQVTLTDLKPGTAYRFKVSTEFEELADVEEQQFVTQDLLSGMKSPCVKIKLKVSKITLEQRPPDVALMLFF